jgi:hypothetical protein
MYALTWGLSNEWPREWAAAAGKPIRERRPLVKSGNERS